MLFTETSFVFYEYYFFMSMKLGHLILILLSLKSFCQFKGDNSFEVNGSINADFGTIQLICKSPIDSLFNPQSTKIYSAEVKNGNFQIKGFLDFPCLYFFNFLKGESCVYSSDYFLINNGRQNAEINISNKMPVLSSASMVQFYKTQFYSDNQRLQKDKKWFQLFSDSLKQIYSTKIPDSLQNVLTGIRNNQNDREEVTEWLFYEEMKDSYLSLWLLYEAFYSNGFKGIYESYFSTLSESIQLSQYGLLLKMKLKESNPTKIGAIFPLYTYRNLKNSQCEKMILKGQYTLIDFWSIKCSQCISQFPEFKELHKTYSQKGFEIINISVENLNQVPFLQKIRKKYNLEWVEYLDENGENLEKLELPLSFPNTFLLNADGVIVNKYINPQELKLILEKTLK